jgi:hypothetical protein
MTDKGLTVLACAGLAAGGLLGMAGTFASTPSVRSLAWGIDGAALVMASALLTLRFYRQGQDLVASGFLVFAIGEGLILPVATMDPAASGPFFAAGISLWAVALALIGAAPVFPLPVRILGLAATVLFGGTARRMFAGVPITPLSSPFPFFAYPVLVATFAGWIWTLLRKGGSG